MISRLLLISKLCNIYLFAGPPTINFISNSQLTIEGNKTSLICNATNDEDAVDSLQIVWYKTKDRVTITGQQDVPEKNKITNITTKLHSKISLDPISHNDDGEYTCQAFNHPQSYIESKTKVTVECKESTMYSLYKSSDISMYVKVLPALAQRSKLSYLNRLLNIGGPTIYNKWGKK